MLQGASTSVQRGMVGAALKVLWQAYQKKHLGLEASRMKELATELREQELEGVFIACMEHLTPEVRRVLLSKICRHFKVRV